MCEECMYACMYGRSDDCIKSPFSLNQTKIANNLFLL